LLLHVVAIEPGGIVPQPGQVRRQRIERSNPYGVRASVQEPERPGCRRRRPRAPLRGCAGALFVALDPATPTGRSPSSCGPWITLLVDPLHAGDLRGNVLPIVSPDADDDR
jgi:hypothetical protein